LRDRSQHLKHISLAPSSSIESWPPKRLPWALPCIATPVSEIPSRFDLSRSSSWITFGTQSLRQFASSANVTSCDCRCSGSCPCPTLPVVASMFNQNGSLCTNVIMRRQVVPRDVVSARL
jgi:hypothetical protein